MGFHRMIDQKLFLDLPLFYVACSSFGKTLNTPCLIYFINNYFDCYEYNMLPHILTVDRISMEKSICPTIIL